MAPEILKDLPYGLPSDVYSYGIVVWEILARETPYKGIKPSAITYQVASMNKRPELSIIHSSCPEKLKSLMIECWDDSPQSRPTFQQILAKLDEISYE